MKTFQGRLSKEISQGTPSREHCLRDISMEYCPRKIVFKPLRPCRRPSQIVRRTEWQALYEGVARPGTPQKKQNKNTEVMNPRRQVCAFVFLSTQSYSLLAKHFQSVEKGSRKKLLTQRKHGICLETL